MTDIDKAQQPKSQEKKPDDLTKTDKKDVELKEEDLGRVTGGAFDAFLKIKGE